MPGYAGFTARKQRGLLRGAQAVALRNAMPNGTPFASRRSGTKIATKIGKASQPGLARGANTARTVTRRANLAGSSGSRSTGTIARAMNRSLPSGGVGKPPHIAAVHRSKAFTKRHTPKSYARMGVVAGTKTASM